MIVSDESMECLLLTRRSSGVVPCIWSRRGIRSREPLGILGLASPASGTE